MSSDDRAQIERLLKIHRRNLVTLETQAANYGGEINAPLNIVNQLDSTREQITSLEARLAALSGGSTGVSISGSSGASVNNSGTIAGRDVVNSGGQPAVPPTQPNTQPQTSIKGMKGEPQQVMLDFQVQGDRATINWYANVLGQAATPFVQPYDTVTLPLVIKALDAMQFPRGNPDAPQFSDEEQVRLGALSLWRDGHVVEDAYKIVGIAIYNALGPKGQAQLSAVRNNAISQRLTTNYVLRFPLYPELAVSLAALPWEALTDERQRAVLLGRGNDVDSCERYITLDQALPPPLPSGQKPHLLALLPDFALGDEEREQEHSARLKSWERLREAGKITYDEISPLTRRALVDYLQNDDHPQPDVIHYFGHGVYQNAQSSLVFDDGRGGPSLVSADRLAALLGDVRLIVIHACQSAMIGIENSLLTAVAPSLSLVAGSVVAMQLTVRTAAATRFSEVFYEELLRKGRSLQEAVAEGRQTLFFEEDDGASWFVPTLYIRSREQKPVYIVS